jgi:hypothetical protein
VLAYSMSILETPFKGDEGNQLRCHEFIGAPSHDGIVSLQLKQPLSSHDLPEDDRRLNRKESS